MNESNAVEDWRATERVKQSAYAPHHVIMEIPYGERLIAKCRERREARRLTACWNALAGIPTKALEDGAIGELVAVVMMFLRLLPSQDFLDGIKLDINVSYPRAQAEKALAKLKETA